MNTEFYQDINDRPQTVGLKEIFSDTFRHHTKEERNRVLTRGLNNEAKTCSAMLKEWQKPWLFFRFAIVAILISIFIWFLLEFTGLYAMFPMFYVVPAFAVPLTVLIFYWELNIPGDISLLETIGLMLLGGLISLFVTSIAIFLVILPDAACIAGPFREEPAKFLTVWFLMNRKKIKYGTQGILIGGAVGVGFSAMESAGYAFSSAFVQSANGLSLSLSDSVETQIIRAFLAVGGHVVWAALYGGAIGLAKGNEKLQWKHLTDPMIMITFAAAYLLHTAWNIIPTDLYGLVPINVLLFITRLYNLNIIYIILIILAWMLMLVIIRRSIQQLLACAAAEKRPAGDLSSSEKAMGMVSPNPEVIQNAGQNHPNAAPRLILHAVGRLNAGEKYDLNPNSSLILGRDPDKANVVFPKNTPKVSRVHCEIKISGGFPTLTDLNSSFGVYLENGQKIKPMVPYRVKNGTVFYLAEKELNNKFMIYLQ